MPKDGLLKTTENLIFANLANPRPIAAFSSRLNQNMSLSYGDTKESLNNRRNFLESSGIDLRNLVCAKQIHRDNIQYVREEDKGRGALSYETSIPDTDALITDKKNLALAVFTADCLSVFLYDPIKPAIGLVHAGWRSSKENLIVKTLRLMQKQFNTRISDLYVGFGPAIGSCCYEVGRDFQEYFGQDVISKGNRYYADLAGINKRQLLESRVKERNIFDSQICTSCHNDAFFSYRKDGKDCGRIMSVIML
jgi:hypothetical protein